MKFMMFFALNVGGAVGWWLGEYVNIWMALLGSGVGSIVAVWLVWRYRDYIG